MFRHCASARTARLSAHLLTGGTADGVRTCGCLSCARRDLETVNRVPVRRRPAFERCNSLIFAPRPAILLPWTAMRQLEPVIWTKGTFLNPQHLQIQDRFLAKTSAVSNCRR